MTSYFDVASSSHWIGTIIAELLTRPEQTVSPVHRSYVEECLAFLVHSKDNLTVAIGLLENAGEIAIMTKRTEFVKQVHRELLALLSPSRHLHFELVASIFCHVMDNGIGGIFPIYLPTYLLESSVLRSVRKPPLRDVMLTSTIPTPPFCHAFYRRRGYPLSFTIGLRHFFDPEPSDPSVYEVYKVLGAQVDRWETVQTVVHSERECNWFESVRCKWSCLRSLSLYYRSKRSDLDPVVAFRNARNLQSLELTDFPISYTPSLPISHLTSFRYRNVYNDDAPDVKSTRMHYLQALEDSPSLSSFEYMTSAAPYTPLREFPVRIVKPLVTELAVGDPAFLESLLLPSLTSLVMVCFLDGTIRPSPYPYETLSILSGSVARSLQSLTLFLAEWDDEQDDCLQYLICFIRNDENNGYYFSLPSLENFHIEIEDRQHNLLWADYMFLDEEFADMVSRRIERSALCTVELKVWSRGGYWPIDASTLLNLRQTPGVSIELYDFHSD
ncbi:hypothetical protein BDZ89DRAFT_1132560 [Hymenopellis radicata]|nr:hypothetical protein BDZ89DRAFT_1132560 [Hymenopellis radicata]